MKCPNCGGTGTIQVSQMELDARRIIAEAAEDWSITADILCGPSRRQDIVEARRHAAHQLRSLGLPLKAVGHFLGGRDHATVINLLRGKSR